MINAWAKRHNISAAALAELQAILAAPAEPCAPNLPPGASEARAQQEIRLEASRRGMRLWRNNCGAVTTDDGRHIRFGLANDSAAMNKSVKSSDLIGITPVTITPAHVGQILGVFTSIEVKRPGWKYSEKGRDAAQWAWLKIINSLGGFGIFATGAEDLRRLK